MEEGRNPASDGKALAMKSDELREKYLGFFESKGHTRRRSDVLVPTWDPSVLFTPAGMNQFKPHFLGKVKLEFTRATTCQKCLRTGDIDNVGRTAYHHTFFEMLGNFSFGDYFKREAILWAWEFLTDKKWLGLDPDRLSSTVYRDDDEAAKVWMEDVGLPSQRVVRMGEEDNFWPASAPSQGPDGVCGPCSEIFYHVDQGKSVEIWNLVFTQFNRVGDPPDNLRPLPSKNIDTGMGLERTASVLQGQSTNFHIDILRPIVEAAAEVCGVTYNPGDDHGRRLRRITDHIRACTFAIHENVYPGPNKEKYVIRRLLRRAVLDGHQLGCREPFLFRLVTVVAEMMKKPYPELLETTQRVAGVVEQEERAFLATIDEGLQRIERIFESLRRQDRTIIHGTEAAELYQTYGVPAELFEAMAAEHGFTFDWDGYRAAMAAHGEASGKAVHMVMGSSGPIDALKKSIKETKFVGYETCECRAEIKGIVLNQRLLEELDRLAFGETAVIVLDQTPFYGESGGQVGDTGELVGEMGQALVTDTQKDGDLVLHHCTQLTGRLSVGMTVTARVDRSRRDAIRRAHSATHLLHHALQSTLGKHAQQQGSKVTDDWLRFDFTNLEPVSAEQIEQIIERVRTRVAQNAPVKWDVVPLEKARTAGAMMLFGEKYPDPVRMVTMGDFSRELCGGTHLGATGEVGAFEIISEEGVSAGTRRIVALTGDKAQQYIERCRQGLEQAAERLGVKPNQVPAATRHQLQTLRELKKTLAGSGKTPTQEAELPAAKSSLSEPEIRQTLRETARLLNVPLFEVAERIAAMLDESRSLRGQLAQRDQHGAASVDDLIAQAEDCDGVKLVVAEVRMANGNLLRQLIDRIRQSYAPCAVLLGTIEGSDKVTLVAGISRDLQSRLQAGSWVKEVAPQVGGGGGGKPDMAQAGGKSPERLPTALEHARQYARKQLG
jgi:alanyl-tRNA synthetase